MKLAELQSLMWRAITWPTGTADFLAQADDETRRRFDAAFVSTPDFDAVARMEVYANAYYWRLHGVLAENYPSVSWLLGEAGFRNLITDYLLAHPSTDPDLRHLGAALPDYLERHDATCAYPGLAELARAEAAMGEALHAADHETIGRDELAGLAPEAWVSMRLHVSPTLRLLSCRWSLEHLAAVRREEARPPSLEDLDAAPPEPRPLLIWRQDFRVKRRHCSPAEGRALRAFADGRSFGELCAMLATAAPQGTSLTSLPATLATWIRGWVDSGMLCAIEVDPGSTER